MSRLLSANFMRMRKNVCFWGGILCMLAAAVLFPVMSYFDMKKTNYINSIDSGLFRCAAFVPVILAVLCSLFVGTEYGDGTIRNKIVIGHQRTTIYFANLIANMAVSLVLCCVFFVVYLLVGIPLLGFFVMNGKVILLFVCTVIVLQFAFTAIFTMIAMTNASKTIASVICILGTFIMFIAGLMIYSKLEEPEVYPGYTISINGEIETQSEMKNPYYLEGTKREIYQFLNDFLPGGQVVQCASREIENPLLLMGYSVLIFVITTSMGIAIFRRKDIK